MTYTDDPVDGSQEAPDLLERAKFAGTVAAALETFRRQPSSSVVALVGAWGSGKSSVIELLARQLGESQGSADSSRWTVVNFNPWLFQDLPSLQIGFLGALQGAIAGTKDRARRRAARGAIAAIGKRIAPLGGIGAAVGLNLAEPLRGIAALIEGQEDPSRDQKHLDKILRADAAPVLVILDDLDRLAPDELLLVFKLIRLVGRLPFVHYLVAYDEDTLLDVLSRTGLVGRRDVRRASDYLEKMIQLRLDLPPLRDTQISAMVDDAIDRMATTVGLTVNDRDAGRFTIAYAAHLRRRLNTPRAIKRYVAQVEALYGSVRDEVDPVDFLLLTWLRTAEPLLYTRLSAEKLDLTGSGDLYGMLRRSSPKDRTAYWVELFEAARVAERHTEGVAEVLGELFPRYKAIRSAREHFNQGLVQPKRVSNGDYFDRYFAFEVPSNDILDSTVVAAYSDILADRVGPALEEVQQRMRESSELAISKLETAFDQSPSHPAAWALLFWMASQVKQVSDSTHSFVSPRQRAIGFCFRMYVQLDPNPSTLGDALDRVVVMNGGLGIAARLVSGSKEHFFSGSPEDVANREAAFAAAREHFADLLEAAFDAEPAFPSDDIWTLIWTWRDIRPNAARAWLEKHYAAGDWSRLDVAARLVSALAPAGIPDPVWSLGDLDLTAVEDLVGIDQLIDEIGIAAIRSSQPWLLERPEATIENRRAYVLEVLRRRLASGDSAPT